MTTDPPIYFVYLTQKIYNVLVLLYFVQFLHRRTVLETFILSITTISNKLTQKEEHLINSVMF